MVQFFLFLPFPYLSNHLILKNHHCTNIGMSVTEQLSFNPILFVEKLYHITTKSVRLVFRAKFLAVGDGGAQPSPVHKKLSWICYKLSYLFSITGLTSTNRVKPRQCSICLSITWWLYFSTWLILRPRRFRINKRCGVVFIVVNDFKDTVLPLANLATVTLFR